MNKPFTGLADEVSRYMPTAAPAHTPGPWEAFALDDGASVVHNGPIGYFRAGAGLDHEVQLANAKLAASAPELLSTLELAAFALEQLSRHIEQPFAKQAAARAATARAAIAKATGGAR